MRWCKRFALVSFVAILAVLAPGCGKSKQSQQEIADLNGRIAALEQQVEALSQSDVTKVTIKLKTKDGITKIAGVQPDPKKLCKEGMLDCPEEIQWRISGSLPSGWSVVLKEKADSPDEGCFKPPSGDSWTLGSAGDEAPSGKTYCDEGAFWEYDVFLMNGAEQKDHKDPLFFLPFT